VSPEGLPQLRLPNHLQARRGGQRPFSRFKPLLRTPGHSEISRLTCLLWHRQRAPLVGSPRTCGVELNLGRHAKDVASSAERRPIKDRSPSGPPSGAQKAMKAATKFNNARQASIRRIWRVLLVGKGKPHFDSGSAEPMQSDRTRTAVRIRPWLARAIPSTNPETPERCRNLVLKRTLQSLTASEIELAEIHSPFTRLRTTRVGPTSDLASGPLRANLRAPFNC